MVVRLEGGDAWLEILDRPSGCGKCDSAGSCGAESRLQRVPNSIGARVGDRVLVSVADGAVMKAAALAYLMPLALALFGAVVGAGLGGDGTAVAGALAGLGIGWLVLRRTGKRIGCSREPLMTLRIKADVIRLQREQQR